jgi:ATP-dependent Clp protease adapter protein ClpS
MDRNSQSSLASRAIAFFRRVRSFLSSDPFRPEHRPPVVFSADTSLITIPRFVPAGFVHGIEILNDNSTPMEFVVSALGECLGLSYTDSVRAMLEIHYQGGKLVPLPSLDEAHRVADAVAARAAKQNYALVCRAVSVTSSA